MLSADTLRALLLWTAKSVRWRPLLPTTVLAALCGIRAAERSRMKWSDIRPGGREEIYLSRAITKTHAARVIPISPALAEWLDYFKAAGYPVGSDEPLVPRPVGPGQTDYDLLCIHIAEARERAQQEIPRNALRHTAASALCVLLGRSKAADILGHSESMLVKHYRRALTEEEAAELVGITPSQLGLMDVSASACSSLRRGKQFGELGAAGLGPPPLHRRTLCSYGVASGLRSSGPSGREVREVSSQTIYFLRRRAARAASASRESVPVAGSGISVR